jgi:hypothetical protein
VSEAIFFGDFAAGAVPDPYADGDGADVRHGLGKDHETVGQNSFLNVARFGRHLDDCDIPRKKREIPRLSREVKLKELNQFFIRVELAVFAGVVQRYVGVRSLFALVDFANVEWLGIDVDADSALVEFRKV